MTETVIALDDAVDTPVLQSVLEPQPDTRMTPVLAPPTKREREAQWLECAVRAGDLADLSLADLRVMANRMFRLLDGETPPVEAHERYTAAVEEIESRLERSTPDDDDGHDRAVFKDSAFSSRYELYLDGALAAYIRYSIVSGQLTLRALVEKPGYEDRGLDRILLRHSFLNAHRRRLAVVPACPAAHTFLDRYRQYRTLARMGD